jgi:hypothetical protein
MNWFEDYKLLKKAVVESYSFAQILRKIGLRDVGSNYGTLKKALKKFKINFETNFKIINNLYSKGLPLDKILVENSTYSNTNALKKKLIKKGFFEYKCYGCNRTEWEGHQIPIKLEHKNGVRTDNRIENLTILCPNCHALTDTFCGKNTYKYKNNKKIMQKKEFNMTKNKKDSKNLRLLTKEKIKKIREREKNKRLKDLKNIDSKKYGWIMKLSRKWGVSHTQVRRYLKNNFPDIYIEAMQRKAGHRW